MRIKLMNTTKKIITLILMFVIGPEIIFSQESNKFNLSANENTLAKEEISDISAIYENGRVSIKWNFYSENNESNYIIEKSTDGVNFREVGFQFMGNSSGSTVGERTLTFSWIDEYPIAGTSYYRFSKIEKYGNIVLTNLIPVFCPINLSAYNTSINIK